MKTLPLLALLLTSAASAQDWGPLYSTGFDGGRAESWSWYTNMADRSTWAVEQDGGNWVLSGTLTSGRNPAGYGAGSWSSYRLKARVKVLAGTLTVDYRYSPCASYGLQFRAGQGQPGWFRQLNCGPMERMSEFNGAVEAGRWYTVEVEGRDANIKVWLDGRLLLNYTDEGGIPAGGFAFEAGQNSHVHIDDVEVTGPADVHSLRWTRTGGPSGGIGHDIRMRPDNPDMLYVNDVSSGVSVSIDGGLTWKPTNTGIGGRGGFSGDAVPVSCLAIDPSNPETLWAGTQTGSALYRSDDGGQTWTKRDKGVVEGPGLTFRGITVHPRDPGLVYAAAEVSSTIWAGYSITTFPFDHTMGVVYKTTDGGDNWTAVWRGNNVARYILLDPRNPEVVYVSTGLWGAMAADSEAGRGYAGGVGILKSTDGGATWTVQGKANGLEGLYVGSLFMHPGEPDVLLAGVGNNVYKDGAGIYRTENGGATWVRTLDRKFPGYPPPLGNEAAVTIYSVEFSTSNPEIAYAAGDGMIYRSSDGGRSWQVRSALTWGPAGVRTGPVMDLQVDPRNPERLFAICYAGGNFLSEDGGRTWVVAGRGYTGALMRDVAVDPGDHRRVYATGRSGPYRSLDGGVNWEGLLYTPPNVRDWFTGGWGFPEWASVAVNPGDTRQVLISDEMTGTIFLGPDYGLDWKIVYHYPTAGGSADKNQGFKGLAYSTADASVVYAGMCADCGQRFVPTGPSGGIWRSTDGGQSWGEANDESTAHLNIHTVAVDPRGTDVVYAGTGDRGVVRTLDGGKSWAPCNDGLGNLDVRAIAVDPAEWWVLYAGTNGGGIYRSRDACASWEEVNLGLERTGRILDLAIDRTNPRVVYAGDLRNGVYRSDDGGAFWYQLTAGLSTRAVRGLALSADGGTLYAATEGEGVFRLDLKPYERKLP